MLNRIKELEDALVEVEKMTHWLERDATEPDKVLCIAGSIRFAIAKVHPKCNWEAK